MNTAKYRYRILKIVRNCQRKEMLITVALLLAITLCSAAVLADLPEKDAALNVNLNILSKKITPENPLKIHVTLINFHESESINVTMEYVIKTPKDQILYRDNESFTIKGQVKSYIREISLANMTNTTEGEHNVLVIAEYGANETTSDISNFEIYIPFWTPERIKIAISVAALIIISIASFLAYRWYRKRKLEKARYLFPVDYKKLPQKDDRSFWIGKIAETDKTAWYSPDDLTTHALTAGATGTGKSVSASVFVEEALKKGIPAVVFDPTVQWTGFVKACNDQNLLDKYCEFGMKKEDARPFRGLIYEVTDPDVKIEFRKYMNPGEITVFSLGLLKPGQYDIAVENIVNTIFREKWEESTELKLLIVFDEVHRLLEKYGGKGGYLSLEKACREFRKWGIGLIMCSQVSADFKEAVQGNILSEIQMNTKSMEDIKKIEQKYGKDFAKRISREAIGVGMIQNPKYNDGKPWFVQFRPTLHSPHKILESELDMYKKFAATLEDVEKKIAKIKESGKDTFDIELELNLAKNKLKEGRFKMAEIYITSLNERLRTWKI